MYINVFLFACLLGAAVAAPYLEGRIVNGTDAAPGEYPYIVSLRRPRHSCGGSILNERFVLTAAHCIYANENNPDLFSIQYGTVDISNSENVIKVKRIVRRDDFDGLNGDTANDVAILELSEPIIFNSYAQPVQLPSSSDVPGDNADAVLIGWGLDKTDGSVMQHLQKVNITLFTDEICGIEPLYNPDVHVCAGIPGGGKGQCNGDSGGPLTVNGKQFGIVSWSVKPCMSPGHPGVFAKVTTYRKWIKEISGV